MRHAILGSRWVVTGFWLTSNKWRGLALPATANLVIITQEFRLTANWDPNAFPPNAPVVVFDGECNLCHGVVRFVLAHEVAPIIRFASTSTNMGARLCLASGIVDAGQETFLFVTEGRFLARSDAAFALCKKLGFPWRWLALLRLVPRPFRDAVYDWVARHRYRWFGRRAHCALTDGCPSQRFYS